MEYVDFAIKYWYLFLALAVVLALLVMGPVFHLIYGVKTVNVWDAVQLINHESAVVIDVSEPNEFKTGHIPDAMNIPLTGLGGRVKELEKHKNKPIVLTCRSGNRSGRGAVTLRKQGFEKVYALSGGIVAWQRDNLPVEK
ncbi:MAG: rhodanese-like domain-containing protein [Acidiferrobacterales bacterium]|nr:rhodanese-like domain-containing protein [Acidiferrobacterales bacterium]